MRLEDTYNFQTLLKSVFCNRGYPGMRIHIVQTLPLSVHPLLTVLSSAIKLSKLNGAVPEAVL